MDEKAVLRLLYDIVSVSAVRVEQWSQEGDCYEDRYAVDLTKLLTEIDRRLEEGD